MKTSFLISTTNCKEIISTISNVLAKHRSLYKYLLIDDGHVDMNNDQHTWFITWDSWVEDGILSCMTVRSLCHIVYGNYDRSKHNITFVLQTIRTEIPVLDAYFSFDGVNFIGDNLMTYKLLNLQQIGEVHFHDIFTPTSVTAMIEYMDESVKEEQSNMQVEETWYTTWKKWKDLGLLECNTLDDVIYITNINVNRSVKDVLQAIFAQITPLSVNCEYQIVEDDLVILQKNLWNKIGDKSKPSPEPKKTPKESIVSTNNSFNLLTQQMENQDDEDNADNKSTPSELSSASRKLSTQFTPPNPKPAAINVVNDDNIFTDEQYEQVSNTIRKGSMDSVDVVTYEKYIATTMYRAQQQFHKDISDFKGNTTRDISAHKHRLKLELDKKQEKLDKKVNDFESKIDKLSNQLKKEEATYISNIASNGNSTLNEIKSATEKISKLMQDLQHTATSTTQIMSNAQRVKNDVQDVLTNSYNIFCQDMKDIIKDSKDEFLEWKQNHSQSPNNMQALLEKQQEIIANQSATIASMAADIASIQHDVTTLQNHSTPIPSQVNQAANRSSSSRDPPETPPPMSQRNAVPTFTPSSNPTFVRFAPSPTTNPTNASTSAFQPIRPNPNTTNTPHPSEIQQPLFPIGSQVLYKQGIRQFQGTVTDFATYDGSECNFTYTISMHHRNYTNTPNVFRNCLETHMTLVAAQSPIPTPQQDDSSMATVDRESQDRDYQDQEYRNNQPWSSPQLADNEYQQPHGSKAKKLNIPSMLKNAKEWPSNMIVHTKYDIKKLYSRLRNNLAYYHIPLQSWDKISKNTDILALEPTNCTNYDSVRKIMSHAIYDYFDQYKEEIFESYTAPQFAIAAFESDTDGAGFLKYILSEVHPNLKDLTDYERMSKPVFEKCKDIHHFVSRYIEWIQEERLLNGREYTDKENIDFILSELDERFSTAKSKIETRINDIYADPSRPKPFPTAYKTNPKLSINIMNLIPRREQQGVDYTNTTPSINKVNTRAQNKKGGRQKPRKSAKFDNIKWKYMPGAVCSACGQNNHEIYSTGCPAMAIFCNCKKFYDSVDPEDLQPVLEQYTEFKAEQRKRQNARKKQLNKSIKALKACSDQPQIRKVFFEQYLAEFPEAEHEPNPFESDNFEESDDSA